MNNPPGSLSLKECSKYVKYTIKGPTVYTRTVYNSVKQFFNYLIAENGMFEFKISYKNIILELFMTKWLF